MLSCLFLCFPTIVVYYMMYFMMQFQWIFGRFWNTETPEKNKRKNELGFILHSQIPQVILVYNLSNLDFAKANEKMICLSENLSVNSIFNVLFLFYCGSDERKLSVSRLFCSVTLTLILGMNGHLQYNNLLTILGFQTI